jgi:predicted NBD/HSP70 family sugar kinase
LLHTCLPQRIVLGGGIGEEHFDRFAVAMRVQIACATQVPKTGIEIVKAGCGNEAGVIGAAGLMFPPSSVQ